MLNYFRQQKLEILSLEARFKHRRALLPADKQLLIEQMLEKHKEQVKTQHKDAKRSSEKLTYSKASDMFSLGHVLFQLASGTYMLELPVDFDKMLVDRLYMNFSLIGKPSINRYDFMFEDDELVGFIE